MAHSHRRPRRTLAHLTTDQQTHALLFKLNFAVNSLTTDDCGIMDLLVTAVLKLNCLYQRITAHVHVSGKRKCHGAV